MIELKIYCDCGQKYKFDVEPVNGRMPYAVACPICKRDGTTKANEMLQQMAVFKPIGAEPAAAPAPVAPPPIPAYAAAPAPAAPPPPPSAAVPRLRINVTAPAAAPVAESHGAGSAPPPTIAPAGVSRMPTSGRPRAAAMAIAGDGEKKGSFGMGVLGAFIGALIGAIIYYVIFKATGIRSFLGLGVGALTGLGAHWLGKGEGSKELGGIAVVFVIVGVLAAQYFVALGIWNEVLDEGYTDSVKEARQVVQAVPHGTDDEIRGYLAKQSAEDGEAVKPSAVSDDDVKEFKQKELPQYQDLASGKTTKEQYLQNLGIKTDKKTQSEEEDTFKGIFILLTINIRGVISMVIAAGMAYKLSTNA